MLSNYNQSPLSTLAWKNQPRVLGCFVPRPRADTITLATITTPDYTSSLPSTPSSESSISQTSEHHPSEETNSEFSVIDPFCSDLPIQPSNSPTPPSPKPQTSPLRIMQLESIPEFSGTHEDKTQPTDFLKAIKRAFLASGSTTDDQKVGLFELYLKSDSPAEEWYNEGRKRGQS